jgi:hypothetical protein
MKELSPLARQLLGGGNEAYVKLYTQQEYDGAVALAKAEIITVAIEATKYAIGIEREECALLVDSLYPEGAQQIRDRALIAKQ